ncbi:MAG: hypothetical protein PF488_04185 [Patescibacteria group bacterium]|jgi:hypothetical protein|nr:hypothetical protein [Patescibacteria group bacterium]
MNNFENPKNMFNPEEIKGVDQLASKEEAITFSEKKEMLKNNIAELKYRHGVLLSELESIIEELDDGIINDVRGQEYAKEKNESLSQVSKYLEEEKKRLVKTEEFSSKIKNNLLSSEN